MFFKGNTQKGHEGQRTLDAAIAAWRDAEARLPAENLSAGARANVRVLARRSVPEDPAERALGRPLARLFLPAARLSAAAAVPALILALSFGWMLRGERIETGPADASVAAMSIEIRKVDGRAVFDIANGGRVHRVYRSTSARDIDGADLFATVEGGFTDTLAGDEGLVFYRIE